MKTLIRLLVLIVPLLLLFNGCGGGGNSGSNSSTEMETETINPNFKKITVSLELPNTTQNKTDLKLTFKQGVDEVIFQKGSGDIKRVILDISHLESNGTVVYDYQNEPMQQNGNIWSLAPTLDTNKAPFTFTARAYDSLVGGTLLFRGTTTHDLAQGSPQISINMEPLTDLERFLPWVERVDITDINGSSRKINFSLINEALDSVDYNISSSSGSFSPSQGTLSFPTKRFQLQSTYTNSVGILSSGTITLKNQRGDIVTFVFLLGNNNITINTPPNINNIKVTVLYTGDVTAEANIDDIEGDTFTQKWTLLEGNATVVAGTDTTNQFQLKNYTSGQLCFEVNASDARGAKSSVRYCILSSSTNSGGSGSSKLFKTGQSTIYTMYDDGYYQKGIDHTFLRSNINNVVIDYEQNLTWQDDINTSSAGYYTSWYDANRTCNGLTLAGFLNWRLPTIYELVNITDKSKYNSAFNSVFQNVASRSALNSGSQDWYWSSTEERWDPTGKAWAIQAEYGYIGWHARGNPMRLRCVRDGIN